MTDNELNEAVARKLGHELILHPETKELRLREDYGKVFYLGPIPNYCNSIEAVWKIVEFTNKSGFQFQLDNHQDKEHGLWTAEFLNKNIEIVADDSANTAPRAICEAFLKLP